VIFQTRIRRNVKLAESPGFGQTILQYDPASHGAADYRSLALEVLALPTARVEPARPQAPVAKLAAKARIVSPKSGSAVA
jgi:chromosome partitioning protein